MDLYSTAEIVGVVFGVLGVWLTIRQHVWCWPVGIVNVALYILVFLHARLYGAMALQVVYLAISAYGWYAWLHGGSDNGSLRVSRTPGRWLAMLLGAATLGGIAFGVFLRAGTDEALPFWDAGTTAFSLAAQWMTTRKWIETWVIWVAVDVVYVGMNVSQHLHLSAGLYALYILMAVLGYREWQRSMRGHTAETGA